MQTDFFLRGVEYRKFMTEWRKLSDSKQITCKDVVEHVIITTSGAHVLPKLKKIFHNSKNPRLLWSTLHLLKFRSKINVNNWPIVARTKIIDPECEAQFNCYVQELIDKIFVRHSDYSVDFTAEWNAIVLPHSTWKGRTKQHTRIRQYAP